MFTAPEQPGEVASLLGAARRDFLAFELLSAQPAAPPEVVFFLAQQSIEKVMKALLAHRKVAHRKTPDLVELSALLCDDKLPNLLPENLMIRLGPYAVEMRYLNIAAPKIDVEEVRAAVNRLLAWAQDSVGDHR